MSSSPSTDAGCPLVLVCRGSHCRGAARGRLCDALSAAGANVVASGCLKVCKGPVAMLLVDGRWEVVSRVRSGGARKQLVAALKRQRRGAIRKRAVDGKRRRRAIERGAVAIAQARRRGGLA